MSRREIILDTVNDLVTDFCDYDRREDEELPSDSIEEAVASGEISIDEIVTRFREALVKALAS